MKSRLPRSSSALLLALVAFAAGCTDGIPVGLRKTPPGNGALVRFDMYHKPLPDIPLPNDQAMWPDPTSRTGLRINASQVAPTEVEAIVRRKFDQLEGWGTFAPITVSFDKRDPGDTRAAIDLANIVARHHGDDYELADDTLYLVNLRTGVPVPVDIGAGAFQYVTEKKDRLWRNDTRRWEPNILWETYDETVDPVTGVFDPARTVDGTPTGTPVYRPEWDTDFDGVLDRPNLMDQDACQTTPAFVAEWAAAPDDEARMRIEAARDRCVTDNLLSFYERETDTLIVRPLFPLEEMTPYAVVVTDRMLDADGRPVKSPFEHVYHPSQEEPLTRLRDHLADSELASYYGDIGGTGFAHVAFAWTYTTAPILEDLRLVRDGLYGVGPFKDISTEFPADADVGRAVGLVSLESLRDGAADIDTSIDPRCDLSDPNGATELERARVSDRPYIVQFGKVRDTIETLAKQGFGFEGPVLDDLVRSFENISHVIVGSVDVPYLIEGGPQGLDPNASWDVNFVTGARVPYSDKVTFLLSVPKETAEHRQPFPVTYYGHGYTGARVESLGFAGTMARQGIATIGVDATSHGIVLDPASDTLGRSLFAGACAAPFSSNFFLGRAKDWDGDGVADSGGDYWTAYLFHTRDVVRQSAVDLLQIIRMLKGFDGVRMARVDFNNDGNASNDLAGDFDADGTPDVGGPNNFYGTWGQSLGGILSPFLGALDSSVTAAAPVAGAGGLLDVGARTTESGAFQGIYLRLLGPLVVGVPKGEVDARSTTCADGQVSVRFVALNTNSTDETEISCMDPADFAAGGTVVVRNRSNGESRCVRIGTDGRFRAGIPTNDGDPLEVAFYDVADAVDTYDPEAGCALTVGDEHLVKLLDTWESGPVADGAPDPLGIKPDPVCVNEAGCTRFAARYYPVGAPLTAPTDGLGFIRNTPRLRRMLNVAASIIDGGDPASVAPYYALRATVDPWGNVKPPTGLLNIVQAGDQNVPLNAGITTGRAAGVVPFLRPDAVERYPALADYATPQALFDELGGRTPHRVYVDEHVMEGIQRLLRASPDPGTCRRNQVPLTAGDVYCHPNCTTPGSSDGCIDDQVCDASLRCVERPVSERDCAQYLYDPDAIDDGLATWGERQEARGVRVGRIAMPATAETLDAAWEPRLRGRPGAPDAEGWVADRRVLAQVVSYVQPRGNHGVEPNNPCEQWQTGRYYANLIARFMATQGADLYYLSHPTSHHCLGRPQGQGNCPFVFDHQQAP